MKNYVLKDINKLNKYSKTDEIIALVVRNNEKIDKSNCQVLLEMSSKISQ